MNGSQDERRLPQQTDEKLPGDGVDVVEKSPLLRWLDNFWYHYKWTVIVVAFFALVLIVCLTQMFSDPVYDINITYSGSYGFSATETERMFHDLSAALPQDFNGDGQKNAGFIRYQIYSEEEIREDARQLEIARQEAEARGEDPSKIVSYINLPYNAAQYQQFTNSLMTGQCYVFLCSPYIYEEMKSSGRVLTFAQMTDTVPQNAYDDCAVLLRDTAMYRSSEMLQKLPEDTLICCLCELPQLFSGDDELSHENAVKTFLGLIR